MSRWQQLAWMKSLPVWLLMGAILGHSGCGGSSPEKPKSPEPGAMNAQTPGSAASTATPTAPPTIDVAWLPEDTEVVVQLRVKQLVEAEILAMLFEGPLAEKMTPGFGMTLDQIERLTLGVSGLQRLNTEQVVAGMEGLAPLQQSTVLVVHANRDLKPEMLQAGGEVRQHAGREYVVGSGDAPLCAALLDARTVVLAKEEFLKQVMESKPGADMSRFQFVNGKSDVSVAFVPKDRQVFQGDGSEAPTPKAQMVAETIQKHATALGLEMTFGAETFIAVQVACDQAGAATTLSTHLRELLDEQRAANVGFEQPQFALELLEHAQTLSLGNVATLGTKLTAETSQQIVGYGQMMAAIVLASTGGDMDFGPPPGPSMEEILARAVPATEAANLPAGSQFVADVIWSKLDTFTDIGAVVPPDNLDARLYLVSGDANRIAAAGNMRVAEARSGDVDLRMNFDQFLGDPRLGRMSPIDRTNAFESQPADGIMLPLAFQHPVPAIEQISLLSGQVDLLVAAAQEPTRIVTLKELFERAETDPLYKSIGLKIERRREEFSEAESIRIQTNANGMLTDLKVLDKNGQSTFEVWASSSLRSDGSSRYQLDGAEGPIADDTRLSFSVLSGLATSTVSFTFKDLPVPEMTTPPTPEQLALAQWTPTELPDALPVGLKLDARCRWSQFRELDADGNSLPRPLDVDIELTGPLISRIVALGEYKLMSVATAAGALTRNPQQFDVEPYHRLVPLEAVQGQPGSAPRARLSFARPQVPPDVLTDLSGQLSIVTAEKFDIVQLPRVFVAEAADLTHPLLTEKGIELKLERIGESLTITAVTDVPEIIGEMEIVSAAGSPFDNLYGGRTGIDGAVQFIYSSEGELPADAVVRLKIFSGMQRHDLPFKFSNLTIPAEPKDREF